MTLNFKKEQKCELKVSAFFPLFFVKKKNVRKKFEIANFEIAKVRNIKFF